MPKKVVKKEVLDLIKDGVSINKIRERTGLGKSTIYYHYKKIKGKKTKSVEFNFANEGELGEFLGIFAGDGNFNVSKKYHYAIRIYTGHYEKGYLSYLNAALTRWFNKKPQRYCYMHKGKVSAIVHRYDSKKMRDLLQEYLSWGENKTLSIRIKRFNPSNTNLNIGILRGLIDTDGNYYAPKKRLSFSTISKNLAEQAYKIAKYNLQVTPRFLIHKDKRANRRDLYTITMHGEKAIHALKLIKPNNPSKTMR